jgi:hypothetical protein
MKRHQSRVEWAEEGVEEASQFFLQVLTSSSNDSNPITDNESWMTREFPAFLPILVTILGVWGALNSSSTSDLLTLETAVAPKKPTTVVVDVSEEIPREFGRGRGRGFGGRTAGKNIPGISSHYRSLLYEFDGNTTIKYGLHPQL